MTANELVNPAIIAPAELKFEITETKFYVSVVTLSKRKKDIKLLEQLKPEFKKTIKQNKCGSQMIV